MSDREFRIWLDRVEASLGRKTSGQIGFSELPDWNFRDAFDDGMRPKDAAAQMLEDNGFSRNALNMWSIPIHWDKKGQGRARCGDESATHFSDRIDEVSCERCVKASW
jgi:hypothetical protein